jgi:hypothetical protein
MSLVKRHMTEAALAANRANAKKSTGPRTRRGKLHSRQNALKHGDHPRLFNRYFGLWFENWNTDPWKAFPRYDPSVMPVPFTGANLPPEWRGRAIHEFLEEVAGYLPLKAHHRGFQRVPQDSARFARVDERRSSGEGTHKSKNSFFEHRSQQAVESTGTVSGQARKRTLIEPAAKLPTRSTNPLGGRPIAAREGRARRGVRP